VINFQVIKFIDRETDELASITAVDRGILELKTAVTNVQRQADNIQQKISEYVPIAPNRCKHDRCPTGELERPLLRCETIAKKLLSAICAHGSNSRITSAHV